MLMVEQENANSVLQQLLLFVENIHDHDMLIHVKIANQSKSESISLEMNPSSLLNIIRANSKDVDFNILEITEIEGETT
jgi:hypothetical protein